MPDDSSFPLNDPATVQKLTALHGHQHPALPCPYGQITSLIEAAAQLGVRPHTA